MHYLIGNVGHLFVIVAFVTSLFAAFSYFKASNSGHSQVQNSWTRHGRLIFYTHLISVIGIVLTLFLIIYNHYFEYHYAWSHSSRALPPYYMISAFWEGQEGSFLLWIFWNAILGAIILNTNKKWEAPVMCVFAAVQAFLASMILGVVIFDLKIGSSPFILLRDAMDAPIFKINPDFVPEDGTGLNPLLQNYWMVIHPPTLFLGFSTTLIPFAFAIAALWKREYRSWIRPALPWSLISAGILGLGIIMGAIWAYETLNFGGYWNWDPVENAVYVPWLFLIASIHTMIIFNNSSTALKTSFVLVVIMYSLILYSTFLTRSGILGDASVHSFTDLGLSGQLMIYLSFFLVLSTFLLIIRWKEIPSTEKEASTYSREFWVFIGVTTLCLMGFQVLIPTSIPVFNAVVELFGGISNMAPPANQIEYYSNFQVWFAVAIALLSGTGQFFWWKRIDAQKLRKALITPIIVSLILSTMVIPIAGIGDPIYLILLVCSIYSIVANATIILGFRNQSFKLSGGSIAHIGIALMLIGILFSSGYSRIISLNKSGALIHPDLSTEMNTENILLFLNETKRMEGYSVKYLGQRIEARGYPGFIDKKLVRPTPDPYIVVAAAEIKLRNKVFFQKGDSIRTSPENTYYEVEYTDANGRNFSLFPRAQINESMGGILASPDILRKSVADIYTHVSSIPDPNAKIDWSESEENRIGIGATFFVKDYVAELNNVVRIDEPDGIALGPDDVAIKAEIVVYGEVDNYTAEPIFLIREKMVGKIPFVIDDLGIRLTLDNVHPETNEFTILANTKQKDYVILKAMVKPMINLLWIGTILLLFGIGLSVFRRYAEFAKMRDKDME